jgi:hypothetical protein
MFIHVLKLECHLSKFAILHDQLLTLKDVSRHLAQYRALARQFKLIQEGLPDANQ